MVLMVTIQASYWKMIKIHDRITNYETMKKERENKERGMRKEEGKEAKLTL